MPHSEKKGADKPRKRRKVRKVMREFKQGDLRSGSGGKVTDKDQALAIALSEARKRKG